MEEINEEEVEEEALPELRSKNCDIQSSVVFQPLCARRVDLFWINYSGQRVKYATLEGGAEYPVNTFVSHPWLFRDADTGLALHGNGQEVYTPTENEDLEEPHVVVIGIPVYRLVDRCLEVFGQMLGDGNVKDLDIPICLKMDLLTHVMNRSIPYELYEFAEL